MFTLVTSHTLALAIEQATISTDATGGVCWPMPRLIVTIRPKCTGSMPTVRTTGITTGTTRMIAAAECRNMPSSRNNTFRGEGARERAKKEQRQRQGPERVPRRARDARPGERFFARQVVAAREVVRHAHQPEPAGETRHDAGDEQFDDRGLGHHGVQDHRDR